MKRPVIYIRNKDFNLKQLFDENERYIRIYTIKMIEEAMESGNDIIHVVEIKVDPKIAKNISVEDYELDVMMNKLAWPNALQNALSYFEQTEEFEICAKIHNIYNKLTTQLDEQQ